MAQQMVGHERLTPIATFKCAEQDDKAACRCTRPCVVLVITELRSVIAQTKATRVTSASGSLDGSDAQRSASLTSARPGPTNRSSCTCPRVTQQTLTFTPT